MKIIKIRPKSYTCMEKMLIFTDPLPPKVYGLYTRENVDIYGQPLMYIVFAVQDADIELAHRPDMFGDGDQLSFKDLDERQVYEQQLTQLQEQLVASMIENQTISKFNFIFNVFYLLWSNS